MAIIIEENATDRQRVMRVISGIVDGINLSGTNATPVHCNKCIRMLLEFFPIQTLGLDEAMLRVMGTGNGATNVTFATNNDLVNRIYGISEIRTEILNELNRP